MYQRVKQTQNSAGRYKDQTEMGATGRGMGVGRGGTHPGKDQNGGQMFRRQEKVPVGTENPSNLFLTS